jgi:hypothetical protein
MLTLPSRVRVYLAAEPVDLRLFEVEWMEG